MAGRRTAASRAPAPTPASARRPPGRADQRGTLLDLRGGLNYYHNTTVTTGDGLTTSKDVGIPGVNLDQYTSGLSNFGIGGYSDPILGFSASQPWDRSEKTWNIATSLTRLMHTHTVKIGGEWRKNTDVLLQTQDAGGPRGRFAFTAAGTGSPAETASLSGLANPLAAFLLDWPSTVQRDLKVIDQPGTKHWAMAAFVQDSGRSSSITRPGLRWEYTSAEGIRRDALNQSGHDQIQVAGYGTTNAVNVSPT
jgi:hypothetical protein